MAARLGPRVAFVDGDERLSFADVERQMLAVARSLIARGVAPGDRIAIWAPNSTAWITAALGILAARAWLVPLNTRLKGDEAASILGTTDARTLFVGDGFLGTDYTGALRAADPGLRALHDTVGLPLPAARTGPDWERFLASGEGVPETRAEESVASATPEEISDVIFTSGTTGMPKGAMLRHGTTLRGYEIFSDHFGLHEGDRYVIPTPFFHCFGYKAGWMASLMSGAVGFPLAVFDAERVLTLIERERITHMPGPPTMFSALLDHPRRDEFDVSSLRHAIIGAATIPAVLVRRMRVELGIDSILAAYGLTENHALGSFTSPADPPEIVATTVGRPLPGVEMRMADDRGHEVPRGSPARSSSAAPSCSAGTSPTRRPRPRSWSTDGSTPVTWVSSTTGATSVSPTARRTCSSSAASTWHRRRSRRSSMPWTAWRRWRWWACPTTISVRWARRSWFSSPERGSRRTT